jgi:hypothetical protein
MYKFGASYINYQYLHPIYLLFWQAIQWLCNNNYKELCFGRTSESQKGLIQFKDGWATRKSHINYYRYDIRAMSFIQSTNCQAETGYTYLKKCLYHFCSWQGLYSTNIWVKSIATAGVKPMTQLWKQVAVNDADANPKGFPDMRGKGMIVQRLRWVWLLAVVALAGAIIIGVSSIRVPILQATDWALVTNEPIEPSDIIVVATDVSGAGVLAAADLVHSGVAMRVAVFDDPGIHVSRDS